MWFSAGAGRLQLTGMAAAALGALSSTFQPPGTHSLLPLLRREAASQLEGHLQARGAVRGGVHDAQATAAHTVALHCMWVG